MADFTTGERRDESASERELEVAGGLADAVRDLIDATVRSQVDLEEQDAIRAEIEALTARLRKDQLPASYGTAFSYSSGRHHWGNAVIGQRNPIAPPVHVHRGRGRVSAEFTLSAAYEGPPSFVHGGVSALILDQMLGEAAASAGHPGMTGTLSVRYRQPTPLGRLRAEGEVTRVEGIKTYAEGRILVEQGDGSWRASVEAEAVFILPRWAREKLAEREATGDAAPNPFEQG
jgi:acyl-coenzyme A thioesterase PaaI-like protein